MTAHELEQHRLLIDQAPTMVWRADPDARCDFFNATWLAFSGHTLQEALGAGWADGIHPDDVASCRTHLRDHFEKRQPFELEYRRRRHDGTYRYVLDRGIPYQGADGSFAGFIGSCLDVDERRKREASSAADEFFSLSLDHIVVAGFDGYMKRVSSSWTTTLGWTEEELTSRPSIEFVHPEDRAATLAGRAGLIDGVPLRALTNRYLCKGGGFRWFEWRSVSHVGLGLVFCVARDVTEQKEAQRALRELNESLTATMNGIADGVIATDAQEIVVRMNPVAEKLTGWPQSEARGKPLNGILQLVHARTRTMLELPVDLTLRDGIGVACAEHSLLLRRDGAELPIAGNCAPMRDAEGRVSGAVLVLRDLSEEKKARERQEQLQRQLIIADRLASVGTLAAGVAHEINNPLTFTRTSLEVLIEEFRSVGAGSTPAQLEDWTDIARQAAEGTERIRKIVRGLRTFARVTEDRRIAIDVRPVLDLSVSMTFNELKRRARVVKDYGEVPLIEGDDTQLGQVFINLLINAAQALPENGTDSNEVRIVTSTDPAGRAVIEVRDTGPGIPESVIGRLFDPFFTTKPVGVGTGLGLSVCHNIVTGMGGQITASNGENGGAVFRVVLPAASSGSGSAPVRA